MKIAEDLTGFLEGWGAAGRDLLGLHSSPAGSVDGV